MVTAASMTFSLENDRGRPWPGSSIGVNHCSRATQLFKIRSLRKPLETRGKTPAS